MYWAVLTLGPLLIGGSLSMTSYLVGVVVRLAASCRASRSDSLARAAVRAHLRRAHAALPLVPQPPGATGATRLIGGSSPASRSSSPSAASPSTSGSFPTYTLIYGTFATIPIFLVWLYVSWVVVLVGATLTAMLPASAISAPRASRSPGREFVDALDGARRAGARAGRRQGGAGCGRSARSVRMLPYRCEAVARARGARSAGWRSTEKDGWLLARDADSLTVDDVYRAFVFDAETWRRERGRPRAFAATIRHQGQKKT